MMDKREFEMLLSQKMDHREESNFSIFTYYLNSMSRDNENLYLAYMNRAKNIFLEDVVDNRKIREKLNNLHDEYRIEFEKLQMEYFSEFQKAFMAFQTEVDILIDDEMRKIDNIEDLFPEFENLRIE